MILSSNILIKIREKISDQRKVSLLRVSLFRDSNTLKLFKIRFNWMISLMLFKSTSTIKDNKKIEMIIEQLYLLVNNLLQIMVIIMTKEINIREKKISC